MTAPLTLPKAAATSARKPADKGRWRSRLAALLGAGRDRQPAGAEDLDAVRATLEEAARIVRRGWVQGAFFLVRTRSGRTRPVGPLDFTATRQADVTGACLVGAIVAAGRLRDPHAHGCDHYPALDRAWSALMEISAAGRHDPLPRAPTAVADRVRDITRWNDKPGRTRAEVEHLLEVAISGTILDAVTRPRSTPADSPAAGSTAGSGWPAPAAGSPAAGDPGAGGPAGAR